MKHKLTTQTFCYTMQRGAFASSVYLLFCVEKRNTFKETQTRKVLRSAIVAFSAGSINTPNAQSAVGL